MKVQCLERGSNPSSRIWFLCRSCWPPLSLWKASKASCWRCCRPRRRRHTTSSWCPFQSWWSFPPPTARKERKRLAGGPVTSKLSHKGGSAGSRIMSLLVNDKSPLGRLFHRSLAPPMDKLLSDFLIKIHFYASSSRGSARLDASQRRRTLWWHKRGPIATSSTTERKKESTFVIIPSVALFSKRET